MLLRLVMILKIRVSKSQLLTRAQHSVIPLEQQVIQKVLSWLTLCFFNQQLLLWWELKELAMVQCQLPRAIDIFLICQLLIPLSKLLWQCNSSLVCKLVSMVETYWSLSLILLSANQLSSQVSLDYITRSMLKSRVALKLRQVALSL